MGTEWYFWRRRIILEVMKLLIVEDDNALREIYSVFFQQAGYEVALSENGLTAITQAVEFVPDIVLLDIMMPEMDGYEFLQALKNNTSMDPVVIVCSNLGESLEIERALQSGADTYLQKSNYSGLELVQAVGDAYHQAMLRRQSSSAETPRQNSDEPL